MIGLNGLIIYILKRSSKIIKAMAPGMFVLHHLIEKYQVKDKEETLKLIENGILDKDEFFYTI